jgi:hypothetical protein
MRPYKTIKLYESPDIADIIVQGRKSSIGRIRRGEVTGTWKNDPKVVYNDHGYCKPNGKKKARRALKRADRARSIKEELNLVAQEEVALVEELQEFEEQFCDEYQSDYDWDGYDDYLEYDESKEELSPLTDDGELSWFENEEF